MELITATLYTARGMRCGKKIESISYLFFNFIILFIIHPPEKQIIFLEKKNYSKHIEKLLRQLVLFIQSSFIYLQNK